MEPYLSDIFGNPHSSEHSFGWAAAKATDKARADVAALIGADPDEIIFTSGASEANNLALYGLLEFSCKTGRNKVVTSRIEHKSVINIASELNRQGKVYYCTVPCDEHGLIDIEKTKELLGNNDVAIISITAVNNEIGTVQNISELSGLARNYGTLVHMDASQAPCAIDIDVIESGIDLLSLSSHKIYGPKGVGALFVQRELQRHIKPLIVGGGQENGLRGGTLPTHQCVGFGAAARVLQTYLANGERERLRSLRVLFHTELAKTDVKFSVNGPPDDKRHPGNTNICFNGCVAQDLLMALQPHVAASSGSACNSGVVEPSYVLRAIGLSEDEARASIRFCVGRYTTENDVREAVSCIERAYDSLYG